MSSPHDPPPPELAGLNPQDLLRAGLEPVDPAPAEPDVTVQLSPSQIASSYAQQGRQPDLPLPEELTSLLPGGAYQVEGFLGQGGMGAVYKGTQIRLKRPVAIKIMRRDLGRDYDFEARFEREAQAMAKLSHPNIVSVIDFGEAGPDYLYIVMELVDGADLMDVIRGGQMTQEMAITLLPQICDALQFAHEHGIIHRDIKPSNIMLTRDGRIKMADFGLAKRLDTESTMHTKTGTGMGTPDYAAPEQFDPNGHIDHRADIYALGVMIYQMITGTLPRGAWKSPSERASVAPQWDGIVTRAMQSDPADRYQHASEVKTDVSSISLAGAAPAAHDAGTTAQKASQTPQTKRTLSTRLWVAAAALMLAAGSFYFFGLGRPSAAGLPWRTVDFAQLSDAELIQGNTNAKREKGVLRLTKFDGWRLPDFKARNVAVRATVSWEKDRTDLKLRGRGQPGKLMVADSMSGHFREELRAIGYTRASDGEPYLEKLALDPAIEDGRDVVLGLTLIGSRAFLMIDDQLVGMSRVTPVDAAGDASVQAVNVLVKKLEVASLDELSEEEALKLLKLEGSEKSPADGEPAAKAAAAEPWLDLLHPQSKLVLTGGAQRMAEGLLFATAPAAAREETNSQTPKRDGAVKVRSAFGGFKPQIHLREMRNGGYYSLHAYDAKTFGLRKRDNVTKTETKLVDFHLSEPLKPGQEYEMELRVQGNVLSAKVDGVPYARVTDDTYAEGFFGVAVFPQEGTPSLLKVFQTLNLDSDSVKEVKSLEASSAAEVTPATATKDAPFTNTRDMKPVRLPITTGKDVGSGWREISLAGSEITVPVTAANGLVQVRYHRTASSALDMITLDPQRIELRLWRQDIKLHQWSGASTLPDPPGESWTDPLPAGAEGMLQLAWIGNEAHAWWNGRKIGSRPLDRSAGAPRQIMIRTDTKQQFTWFKDLATLSLDGLESDAALALASSVSRGPAPAALPSPAAEPWEDMLHDPSNLELFGVERTADELRFPAKGSAQVPGNFKNACIRFRFTFDSRNRPHLSARSSAPGSYTLQATDEKTIRLGFWDNAVMASTTLRTFPLPLPIREGQECTLELRAVGSSLTVRLDDKLLGTVEDTRSTAGRFGVNVTLAQPGMPPAIVRSLEFLDLNKAVSSSSSTATATKSAPFINTLGMKFVPVPGTDVLMCAHETRRKDYEAFASSTPGVDVIWKTPLYDDKPLLQADDHPVVSVCWTDARAFADWLSRKEGKRYRLPTEKEWNLAVVTGLQDPGSASPEEVVKMLENQYPWGTEKLSDADKLGNYKGAQDGYEGTSPVMSFPPNHLGIHDLGGNVWEWCQEFFEPGKDWKVIRGGSFLNFGPPRKSGWRIGAEHDFRRMAKDDYNRRMIGFRLVMEKDPKTATKTSPWINTLGMKFVPVPGTAVRFCAHETRYRDYAAFASENPGTNNEWVDQKYEGFALPGSGDAHPVVKVNWEDAQTFCAWLSKKEGRTYRLPTDAEWSHAAGVSGVAAQDKASTPSMLSDQAVAEWPWGTQWPPPSGAGNFGDESRKAKAPRKDASYFEFDDGHPTTAPVMSFKPNKHGLHDLSGNVWEWCADWYDGTQQERVLRGGSWMSSTRQTLFSSYRRKIDPAIRINDVGFRVVLAPTDPSQP